MKQLGFFRTTRTHCRTLFTFVVSELANNRRTRDIQTSLTTVALCNGCVGTADESGNFGVSLW